MLLQVLLLSTIGAAPADSLSYTNPPTIAVAETLFQRDTVRRRRKAVELSDWYGRRLTIHRTLSYVTLPVFAAQYVAGEHLFKQGAAAPTWAKTTHRVGATALAGIFTVNTVTGLWNLWDSRSVPQHRALRTVHALMMLTTDAAFTWAGATLSNQAEQSLDKRKLHRKVALYGIGLTVGNGLMMKYFNK
jgi:hypothetical protein